MPFAEKQIEISVLVIVPLVIVSVRLIVVTSLVVAIVLVMIVGLHKHRHAKADCQRESKCVAGHCEFLFRTLTKHLNGLLTRTRFCLQNDTVQARRVGKDCAA